MTIINDFQLFEIAFQKGSKGRKVRFIQGLLNLQGYIISIDGRFGPATEYAVKEFQKKEGLSVDGIVGIQTFEKLISPMMNSMKDIPANGRSLGEMAVAYAQQHLAEHPREVGGQNMGPWVKLYMNGNEGPAWPWCAGFACFVLKQACKSLNLPLPFKLSYSCDSLAANAKEKGRFLSEAKVKTDNQLTPGCFFLDRRTPYDWGHTGIVIKVEEEIFHTIEGNTNDEGSREGYEVCQRVRGYNKKDFILI